MRKASDSNLLPANPLPIYPNHFMCASIGRPHMRYRLNPIIKSSREVGRATDSLRTPIHAHLPPSASLTSAELRTQQRKLNTRLWFISKVVPFARIAFFLFLPVVTHGKSLCRYFTSIRIATSSTSRRNVWRVVKESETTGVLRKRQGRNVKAWAERERFPRRSCGSTLAPSLEGQIAIAAWGQNYGKLRRHNFS